MGRYPPSSQTSETSERSIPETNKLTRSRVQAFPDLVADSSSSAHHHIRYEKRLIC